MSAMIRPPDPLPSSTWEKPEEVLVVPRVVLLAAGVLYQGFVASPLNSFLEIVAEHGVFRPRNTVEDDATLKQIIPYGMVVFEDQVFLFRRKAKGGETRLYEKLSIGVGGHINPEGVSQDRLVEAGLARELEEELVFKAPYRQEAIGLINDDDDPVGRVHAGIVYRVMAADPGVSVREKDILEGGFVPVSALPPLLLQMESWSRLTATALFCKTP